MSAGLSDTAFDQEVIRRRMHGLYLSRSCDDIRELSREMMGLHCWFHRNVQFSALIRGADIYGWKRALTKTWLYRGTLHGVAEDDLPELLALHTTDHYWERWFGREMIERFSNEVIRCMEDGVTSRTEFRRIFSRDYDDKTVEAMFSPWGGIFVVLARQGRVAFRDMTSRDFDLISAEPTHTRDEVLPRLLRRYFTAFGPARLADAAWFFGFCRQDAKRMNDIPLDDLARIERGKAVYYYSHDSDDSADIPEITLLSGFDPYIVSYSERDACLPQEYKSKVILKSGICLPSVAIDGRVAGLWNIKNNEPIVEFFEAQPARVVRDVKERVEAIRWRTARE